MAEDESDERRSRTSDIPVDLSRERETFVRQFLRKGVELTEGLIDENKELRSQLAAAQRENAALRAQVASDDAIRDLLRKIESLEHERKSLVERSSELEESSRRTEHRNLEVEQELHDLANLYIASSHLHSTLSVRGVMRHLKELLQQLVGAETFVVYLMDESAEEARPVGWDGVEDASALASVKKGEGAVGEVLMTGVPRVVDRIEGPGTLEAPIAAIPLMVRDEAVGAIAIASVFEQKGVWAAVDHELFNLLGSHAATALIAANQYTEAEDAFSALRGLGDHLNPNP
ncbi:MAG TPA: GAF domain-containing protein [Sandaracinaceae bacterium LLY-WYZ-13_1]|nr:GAF domain-containing protein [Sandaracinaceae bacterium LLY-WYZ-13_1]